MKTTTIIATQSADMLTNLTVGELKTHAAKAAAEFASYAEKGCKYLGLLRGRLHQQNVTSDESYKLISKEMVRAGFDEQRAKSAVNNGNGHAALAMFLIREDGGKPICERRFYAVPVSKAKAVAATLKRGGDEAIADFNAIPLRKGKLNRKSLAEFLPSKSEGETTTAASDAVEGAEVTPAEETAAALTPLEVAAKGIALLTKALPKLEGREKDAVLSELAKLIG